MESEQELYWGYKAYRFGELFDTGPNPVPESVQYFATEIHWIPVDPSTLPEPEPAI